jgi:hypothetical protein
MKKCIVINGVSGSGKDTFIEIFAQLYDGYTANISSVDLVKDIMYDYMDWDGIKTKESRNCMVQLKQILIDYGDIPFKYCLNKYNKIYSGIVFMHIREPEEIDKIKKAIPDAITILIDSNESSTIPNDDGVYNYEYDYIVHNSKKSKDSLYGSANLILNEIL